MAAVLSQKNRQLATHQRLLDLEARISEIGSTYGGSDHSTAVPVQSVSSRSSGGPSSNFADIALGSPGATPPRRPSSAIRRRPSSAGRATSELRSAAYMPRRPARSRPSSAGSWSAGGSRGSSGSWHRGTLRRGTPRSSSQAGSVRGTPCSTTPSVRGQSMSFRSRAPSVPQDRDRERKALCDLLGTRAAKKYSSAQRCFLGLDHDRNGSVDRGELRKFFHTYNLPTAKADRLFDLMDLDQSGSISFDELCTMIGPYIQAGYKAPKYRTAKRQSVTPPDKREVDVLRMCQTMGLKAHLKFRNVRDCFRGLDQNKDGTVTRDEMSRFVESFGFARSMGNQLFELLAKKEPTGEEFIDYRAFVDFLSPFISPGHAQTHVDGSAAIQTRRRPQSAKTYREGGRSSWDMQASMLSQDSNHVAGFRRRSPPSSAAASSVSSAHDAPLEIGERTFRGEVFNGHRGGQVLILPERQVKNRMNDTWHSTVMGKILGSCGHVESRGMNTSKSWHGPFLASQPLSVQGEPASILPRPPVSPKPRKDVPRVRGVGRVPKRRETINHDGEVLYEAGHNGHFIPQMREAVPPIEELVELGSSLYMEDDYASGDAASPMSAASRRSRPQSARLASDRDMPRGRAARKPRSCFDHRGMEVFDISGTQNWGVAEALIGDG